MGFHSVRFPAAIGLGASGGVERRTEIVRLANGFEERNAVWATGRRRYDAGLGVRSLDDLHAVVAFFEARRGMLHAFRWKDWLDHKSCAPSRAPSPSDQLLGHGDGETRVFGLRKAYGDTAGTTWRPIVKPVAGTVAVAVDGMVASAAVDHETGTVMLDAAPPEGAAVTAGFEFDVPVRFDADALDVNLAAFEAGEAPSIPLIEVRV
ncbi:MAG: TIGR02217 family protein [Paracoccaceae bacterium]